MQTRTGGRGQELTVPCIQGLPFPVTIHTPVGALAAIPTQGLGRLREERAPQWWGYTWPPTKPAFSLGMLVCVSARTVRLAFASSNRLLNCFSSCQGRSLCLGGQGHDHLHRGLPSTSCCFLRLLGSGLNPGPSQAAQSSQWLPEPSGLSARRG